MGSTMGDLWGLGNEDTVSRGFLALQMGDNLPAVDLGDTCTPVQLSLGPASSCVLCEGGSVKCWGASSRSCLATQHGHAQSTMGNNLPTLNFGTGKSV
eukprot:4459292-Amphidinium_carterae.1